MRQLFLGIAVPVALAACAMPAPPAAKRPARQEQAPPPAWRAFGNEPFWSARVQGTTLAYTTPGNMGGERFDGVQTQLADGVRFEGGAGARTVTVEIHRGECSDGMSDDRHAYVARMRLGGVEYKGCAEAAK